MIDNKFYNNVKTVLLLGALTGVIVAVGGLIGREQGVIIALVIAAVMNVGAYFFSDKIAIASMGGQEVGPDHELYRIVAPMAQKAGLPMPRVYVSPQMSPNAFATGRNPTHAAVCATEGLLQMLDRREIAGVMAHELAHVKHRDILISTVAATIAGALSSLSWMFMWGGMGGSRDDREGEGGGGLQIIGALVAMIVAPLAAALIQAAISRSREFNADTEGAAICGDPRDLASALQKIHAAAHRIPLNTNPAFNALLIAEPISPVQKAANLFSTHPPLEERLANLLGPTGATRARRVA